jgi:fructose transport system ATP-binding protein
VDQEGEVMTATTTHTPADRSGPPDSAQRSPVLSARGLVKTFGKVVGLDGVDLDLYPGEVLAVIGDNGAGKSTLIKCLTGALTPDSGELFLEGRPAQFKRPQDAREAGIETVYQTLAVAPALDIASNLFLGREKRRRGVLGSVFRMLDQKGMRREASQALTDLGIGTLQNVTQAVETLSGGQRQAVSVARAAAFGSKVIVLDEPTAALGVKESNHVLRMIEEVRSRVRGRRPHPHPAAGPLRRRGDPTVAHDARGGGDHDRCDHPRGDTGPGGGLSRWQRWTGRQDAPAGEERRDHGSR